MNNKQRDGNKRKGIGKTRKWLRQRGNEVHSKGIGSTKRVARPCLGHTQEGAWDTEKMVIKKES